MAKRELIDRNHLLEEIKKLQKSPWYNCGKNDMTVLRALYNERKEAVEVMRDLCVNDELAITEQEIIEPYLEKLKEQVSHCNLCLLVNKEDVLGFIDNLLSESEE